MIGKLRMFYPHQKNVPHRRHSFDDFVKPSGMFDFTPSEERSVHEKLWRSRNAKNIDPPSPEVIHRDEILRQRNQEAFALSPQSLLSGLAREEPVAADRKKPIALPMPVFSPQGRRSVDPKHYRPLTDEQILTKLFPDAGGMSQPTRITETADVFARQPNSIINQLSPQTLPANRRKQNQEYVVLQDLRSKSAKGDMSLAKAGVKKISHDIRASSTEPVPGFKGLGMYSEDPHPTGLKRVAAFSTEKWDPLGFKIRTVQEIIEKFRSSNSPRGPGHDTSK